MKRVFVASILALFVVSAYTQDYMPEDRPAVSLRRAYQSEGLVFPVTRYPVSRQALVAAAEALPPGSAREAAFTALGTDAGYPEAGARTGGAATIAYLMDLRSAALPFGSPARSVTGFDPYRDYLDQPPVLELDGHAEAESGLSLAIGLVARRDYAADGPRQDNLPTLGLPGNPVAVDNHVFARGIVAWSDGEARVAFGRDRLHLGPGDGSTLLHSGALPYLDAMTAVLPMGRWTIDWVIGSIVAARASGVDVDTGLAPAGTALQDEFELGYYGFEAVNGSLDGNPSMIFYNVHRAEWTGRTLRMAVAGQMLVARRSNQFTFLDFMPVAIWHNADVRPNNMSLVADVSWAVAPGLAINAMAGFDDISAGTFGMSDAGVPTVDAYLLSASYFRDFGPAALDAYLEAGYTHYLWGNYDGYETMGADRNVLARAIGRYKTDAGAMLLPLTSPYGPGALWTRLETVLEPEGKPLSIRLDALILSKNSLANLVTTPYTSDAAVAGAPRTLLVEMGLTAGYEAGGLKLSARPSFCWLDAEFSVNLSVLASWRLGE